MEVEIVTGEATVEEGETEVQGGTMALTKTIGGVMEMGTTEEKAGTTEAADGAAMRTKVGVVMVVGVIEVVQVTANIRAARAAGVQRTMTTTEEENETEITIELVPQTKETSIEEDGLDPKEQ